MGASWSFTCACELAAGADVVAVDYAGGSFRGIGQALGLGRRPTPRCAVAEILLGRPPAARQPMPLLATSSYRGSAWPALCTLAGTRAVRAGGLAVCVPRPAACRPRQLRWSPWRCRAIVR